MYQEQPKPLKKLCLCEGIVKLVCYDILVSHMLKGLQTSCTIFYINKNVCVFLIFLNQGIIEETVQLLKKEESHKVIVQGILALLRLGKLLPDNVSVHQKLVLVAKQVSTVLIAAEGFLGTKKKYFYEKMLWCVIQSYMYRMNNTEFAAVFVLRCIVMSTVVLG